MAGTGLSGAAIIAAIKQAGVGRVIALPDITTSRGLLFPIADDPDLTLTRVCKEDEAIGISAGLWLAGERSVVLIQHTGLLDSVNALRGIAVEYRMPVCLVVGLLAKAPGVKPREAGSLGVRIVEPILAALGLAHDVIETDSDVPRIAPAIERAYADNAPMAILIGRSPTGETP